MKNRKFLAFLCIAFVGLVCVVALFAVLRLGAYAQVQRPIINENTNTADVPRLVKSTVAVASAPFSSAALANKNLRTSLAWDFGGKRQAGWYLYDALIGETIGSDDDPASPEFARSLSEWQSRSRLASTGILDKETLSALIKFWQSQRLGRAAYPSEDKLLSAPITEFYDSTRSSDLLKLERETYAAYKRMLAAAIKDSTSGLKVDKNGELAAGEKFLRIVSAFRSREHQERLRKAEPGAGRGALAKNSPHFTGQAIDIYVGGEPVSTKDPNRLIQVQSKAYKWLVKNAHKFGFYPYFYEPWHWEYVPNRQSLESKL